MNIDPKAVENALKTWEKQGIARISAVVAELAEIGLATVRNGHAPPPEGDPEKTPAEAAAYFSVSWQTFRDSWIDRYQIQSVGEGKSRRFPMSELIRVGELRKEE